LLAACRSPADTLADRGRARKATLIVAYTHGQPAQPTTFGHYLGAIIEVLLRDIERMKRRARSSI
jgi:argininosuccinate lyase